MIEARLIADRLAAQTTFEAAFDELRRLGDRGLYAELLSGTTWTGGDGAGTHILGHFQPGRPFRARKMLRASLDVLLLFLVVNAEGPLAAALREDAVSLRFDRTDAMGELDLAPLAALPNLRALGLRRATIAAHPPTLPLDRLEIDATDGIDAAWIAACAPAELILRFPRSNGRRGDELPPSLVRLHLQRLGGPARIERMPLLEVLTTEETPDVLITDCPQLREVRIAGESVLERISGWSGLPALAELRVGGAVGLTTTPSTVHLPPLPSLHTLSIGSPVALSAVPSSVRRFRACLADDAAIAALERPVDLRAMALPAHLGLPPSRGLPPIRDGSELEVLALTGRAVDDADLGRLLTFPRLKRLYLYGTPITSLSAIAGHPTVELVDLRECTQLRNASALATLPRLRVTLMGGACALRPGDLESEIAWTANCQPSPDIDALLQREPPRPTVKRMPRALPADAEALYREVFPLLLRRDYDSIDIAVDEFARADIDAVWAWWLDGVALPDARSLIARLCPRRMSQAEADQPYARHAALRLIGAAPATCAVAEQFRRETGLKSVFASGPGGCFDLSLLAGLPALESAIIGCATLRLPSSPRPDWLPRLTSLHIRASWRDVPERLAIEHQVRTVLPHVPDIVIR